jgi:hypothetical protein
MRNKYEILVGKSEGKRPLSISMRRLGDAIKMIITQRRMTA